MKYSILVSVLILCSCQNHTPEKTGLEGRSLPNFSILLADSTTYLHTENIGNKRPFALFVLSANCPYCKSQMANIVKNKKKVADLDIYIIMASTFSEIKSFSNTYKLDYLPNVKIGQDTANFFAQYLNITGVPFTALYDKNKKLIRAYNQQIGADVLHSFSGD